MSSDFEKAIEAFNCGEYFDAAEAFEGLSSAEGELKELVGALNRVAAGLHMRFERGGRRATINLLSQALLILDELKPERGGIDVELFFDQISAYTEQIRATPKDEHDGIKHRARLFLERRRAPKIPRKR